MWNYFLIALWWTPLSHIKHSNSSSQRLKLQKVDTVHISSTTIPICKSWNWCSGFPSQYHWLGRRGLASGLSDSYSSSTPQINILERLPYKANLLLQKNVINYHYKDAHELAEGESPGYYLKRQETIFIRRSPLKWNGTTLKAWICICFFAHFCAPGTWNNTFIEKVLNKYCWINEKVFMLKRMNS